MIKNTNANFEYTEMVYGVVSKREMLCHNVYKGYDFFIISYGTHPCAYIKIPKNHPYYNKSYIELPQNCHGDFTYSSFNLLNNSEFCHMITDTDDYYIGWDYAHSGDYSGLRASSNGRRWTVLEIYEEVKNVIEQVIKNAR